MLHPFARFSALRHRDFRLYWIGFLVSISGQQMLWMVQPWLIYELSGSKVYLGLNALAQAVPATALVLLGGVVADKFDQRKLLIGMQGVYIALLGVLATLALTELLVVWHIFVVSFIHSGVSSFENPARQSMFPHLVDRDAMPNAVAMNSSVHPATRIFAPGLGGLILAGALAVTDSPRVAGGTVLLLAIGGVAVYALMLMRVHLPPVKRSRGGTMLSDIAAGTKFIWRNRIVAHLIGMAYYNMFFGISLGVLFPVIAKDIFEVGPFWLGMMWTSTGFVNSESFGSSQNHFQSTSYVGLLRISYGRPSRRRKNWPAGRRRLRVRPNSPEFPQFPRHDPYSAGGGWPRLVSESKEEGNSR